MSENNAKDETMEEIIYTGIIDYIEDNMVTARIFSVEKPERELQADFYIFSFPLEEQGELEEGLLIEVFRETLPEGSQVFIRLAPKKYWTAEEIEEINKKARELSESLGELVD